MAPITIDALFGGKISFPDIVNFITAISAQEWIYYAAVAFEPEFKDFRDSYPVPMQTFLGDMDWNMHQNNAVYSGRADYVRYNFYIRLMRKKGVKLFKQGKLGLAVGGSAFSFVNEIRWHEKYTLDTQIIAYDRKWFYISHTYINKKTNKLYCVGCVRVVFKEGRKTLAPQDALTLFGYKDAPATYQGQPLYQKSELQKLYGSLPKVKEEDGHEMPHIGVFYHNLIESLVPGATLWNRKPQKSETKGKHM